MELQRAEEILQSKEKIKVKHEGQSVWIDGVDVETKTARVHPEEDPDNQRTVSLEALQEIH